MSIRDNLGGGVGAVLDSLEEISANTESGKAAGALAVKELNESLNNIDFSWKLVGTATGSKEISLPTDFNELYIKAGSSFAVIPRVVLTSKQEFFIGSGGYFTNSKRYCSFKVSTTSVILNKFTTDDSDVTSSTTTTVYYR